MKNQKKYPKITKSNKINFAAVRQVESGNPYFDPSTGKFSHGIPGARVLAGENLLKSLPANFRRNITDRVRLLKANQVGFKEVDGQIVVVILKNGKQLNTFSVQAQQREGQVDEFKVTKALRDQFLDVARDLKIGQEALDELIQDRMEGNLTTQEIADIKNMIIDVRLDDLVDYLDQKLKNKIEGVKQSDFVRISVGRGYEKRSFSDLSVQQANEVLKRLQGRGWSEAQVQDNVAASMPRQLREKINVDHKEENPENDNE